MPLPVTVVRDPWDWAVVWAAIAGVFVAIIAIVFAAVAFYVSNRALVRERRNVFELGLLARLVDICGHNNPGSREVVLGLLRMLPPDDLPGVRREIEQGGVSGPTLNALLGEFNEAVDRRLEDKRRTRTWRWPWRRSSRQSPFQHLAHIRDLGRRTVAVTAWGACLPADKARARKGVK